MQKSNALVRNSNICSLKPGFHLLLAMAYTDQFPVLDKFIYLNTANSGILSREQANWRNAHDQEFLSTGSLFRLNRDEFLKEGREAIAIFFNAPINHTYLVPNFSHGFNIFLEGLSGPQRFLLLKEDYPSVNYPVESRGHECAFVPVDENLEGNILNEIERFDPEILAFSLVQYTSGINISLDFLKQVKQRYPNLLIVADGTQFCGTAPFDFESSAIDVLICSGYKWMLGGYGNGFVLLNETAAGQLYTNEKRATLPTEGFLKGRGTMSLYFEPGHLDTLNFGTLFNGVKYLREQGIHQIESRINRLILPAFEAFKERNLLADAVKNRTVHSSIFSLLLPAEKIKELQDNNIILTSRGAGARVSFHFYNSLSDLEALLHIIDR